MYPQSPPKFPQFLQKTGTLSIQKHYFYPFKSFFGPFYDLFVFVAPKKNATFFSVI